MLGMEVNHNASQPILNSQPHQCPTKTMRHGCHVAFFG
jgi:hypothetical protein